VKVGTKSLLFGAHQFVLHPFTVVLAWHRLYSKWPNWKELLCIIIHDWGYWGCKDMDGVEGSQHPMWAAMWVFNRGWDYTSNYNYSTLCMFHSRHLVQQYSFMGEAVKVSRLYYADKLSFCLIPWWVYIPLGLLSGEIHEYRAQTDGAGVTNSHVTWRKWYNVVSTNMLLLSINPNSSPYLHSYHKKE
jgi:hypothetical protein